MLTDFTGDVPIARWYATLTQTHQRRIELRVLDLDHRHIAWIGNEDIIDGQVTIDVTSRAYTRVLNLQLRDPSRSIGWEPDSASALPRHLKRMVQVFYSVAVPGYGWVQCPVFCGPVAEMDRDGAEVSIVGHSKEVLAQGSFGKAPQWHKGRKIVDVIGEILELAGEKSTRIHLPDLPGRIQAKDGFHVSRTDQPWAKAQHLAGQIDCVLFYNGRGHAILRRKPKSATLTVDRYWLTSGLRFDRPELTFHNRFIAVGKKPKGDKPRPSVQVDLPASNPFSGPSLARNGKPRWLVLELDRPHVESKVKLRQIAEHARDEKIRYRAEVSFDCLPFPNVEEWDLIRAVDPVAGAAVAQVKQATIPLNAGSQTIGAIRKVARVKKHGGHH